MINKLILWDQELFLKLNGLHHSWIDPVMLFISNSMVPIFIISAIFLIFGYLNFKKKIIPALIFLLLSIGISDSVSSRIFKPGFKRLRPCKEEVLKDKVYTPSGKCRGGKYGFFSSHAANSFTAAMFIWLLFKSYSSLFIWLFPYATLVSYSRIYLAKHYPLDILVGAIFGIMVAMTMFKLFSKFFYLPKYKSYSS